MPQPGRPHFRKTVRTPHGDDPLAMCFLHSRNLALPSCSTAQGEPHFRKTGRTPHGDDPLTMCFLHSRNLALPLAWTGYSSAIPGVRRNRATPANSRCPTLPHTGHQDKCRKRNVQHGTIHHGNFQCSSAARPHKLQPDSDRQLQMAGRVEVLARARG